MIVTILVRWQLHQSITHSSKAYFLLFFSKPGPTDPDFKALTV